jgi:three-Cys-motif partner protein
LESISEGPGSPQRVALPIPSNSPFLRGLTDDGLYTPDIKAHSLEKIGLHNAYADRFTSSMYRKWPQLAYVGLYSGAGRALVARPKEIVETTAMGVFRLHRPFTKYIFVDNDRRCLEALRARVASLSTTHDVTYMHGDTADLVDEVRGALPAFSASRGLLSFCFVDPFAANLRFKTIRALSDYRMDFLILLMLGRDVRTNLRMYLGNRDSTRIADLTNCPSWREEYAASGDRNIVRFILAKFDEAMVNIGYLSAAEHLRHQIAAAGTAVLQYVLVFYSKNRLAQRFWQDIRVTATDQTTLNL